MNLAHQAWELGNVAFALDVLERERPAPGAVDLRDSSGATSGSSAAAAGSPAWPCTTGRSAA